MSGERTGCLGTRGQLKNNHALRGVGCEAAERNEPKTPLPKVLEQNGLPDPAEHTQITHSLRLKHQSLSALRGACFPHAIIDDITFYFMWIVLRLWGDPDSPPID